MFADKPPRITVPTTYAALRNSKALILSQDEHAVFGDGSVVIKSAPGHTAGHQVLYLKLAKTGGVVISGVLYVYPESRTLQRYPTHEFNQERSAASRAAIEAFLNKTTSATVGSARLHGTRQAQEGARLLRVVAAEQPVAADGPLRGPPLNWSVRPHGESPMKSKLPSLPETIYE